MTARILVVDDHDSWRRHLSSELQENSQYQVVGETGDGLEAVQTAESLRPDLIVLDIGLPTLNGIEAARRIRTDSPDSKILFFSEHRAPEIAQAALETGADGYVIKSDADSDLLPAIEALIQGRMFISARFAGNGFEKIARQEVPRKAHCHEVQLCSDEASLLDGFARFALAALKAGSAAIGVTTIQHRDMLHQGLKADGLDIDLAIEQGRYLWLDVADVLSAILVDGLPDAARFWNTTTTFVAAAVSASTCTPPRVVGFGECAPVLWRQGQGAAAIQLEHLWDKLARKYDVDILCGYMLTEPLAGEEQQMFERIWVEHSMVHPR